VEVAEVLEKEQFRYLFHQMLLQIQVEALVELAVQLIHLQGVQVQVVVE
jgi:hypothetical protein